MLMPNIRNLFLLLFLVLSLASSALAASTQINHLKLLAVQETGNGYNGSDADLYLEVREGSSRVFLDTYPLTKMDTQVSTRFAKEIACKHYHLDCDKYDFIYTIKAKSNIIGGPSAGAAMAALTAITMLELKYDEKVAITGTINSGATIGPVGGLKEKTEAAKAANLRKVLIPKGTAMQSAGRENINQSSARTNSSNNINATFNLIEYGKKNLSLELVEVSDLDEAIFQLTGRQFNNQPTNITENPEYKQIMQGLQRILCNRTSNIESELFQAGLNINQTVREEIIKKKRLSEDAALNGDYYSAASYCFGNNIVLKNEYYRSQKIKLGTLSALFASFGKKTEELNNKINQEKISTISDLQALMIVKERLTDVELQIRKFNEERAHLSLGESYYLLAYSEERYFSAVAWTQFFSMNGKKFVLDKEKLKNSCTEKIAEAEERYQYASIYLGEIVINPVREKIDLANGALQREELELCLIEAAQAKAEANAILSSLGVSEDNFNEFIESKSKAVEKVISENSAEGIFPILGYSYYQYATSLKEQEKYTTLVYLEYALEMSDLEIYFPEEKSFIETSVLQLDNKWWFLSGGIAIGIVIALLGMLMHKIWFRKPPKLEFKREKKNGF